MIGGGIPVIQRVSKDTGSHGSAYDVTRPFVSGKFVHVGKRRLLIQGVSYGTFAPNADGALFPASDSVARDFRGIVELGANTLRTYTPPPISVLDEAAACGLHVIVGVPWAQHVAFLDSARTTREIRATMRRHVRRLASHPATLLFAVGNEIPPSIVRWYGRRRIEQFLRELFDEAKAAAGNALLTYINYPPTEYLEISFFDICAFNVFLHNETDLAAYLARLHHIAGPRPLLVSEVGADSLRNGEREQAALVAMQVRTALREGAAGAIVFSWTDDWWRGGRRVDDWEFGLVNAVRRPKIAYRAVQRIFRSAPPAHVQSAVRPSVSVVVCAYNAAATIDECLTAIEQLRYQEFEVIVVNDGSTDATGSIADQHQCVCVIHTANAGLGAARNVGLERAAGEIVAYTDADVRVDPDWLTYLVQRFADPDVVAAGGPNVVPADDAWVAQCVARAPGAPTHVLLEDRLAEHIPGCNCAFRRDALLAVGGFDSRFVRAGDDVDVCWRLQARGWKIGFAPAALVWHHHRPSVRTYVRQQIGYGEGETWLMRKHPEKFVGDRIAWRGHIYSPLPFIRSLSALRINAGPFGSAGFPSIYRTDAHPLTSIVHSGRWQIAWVTLLAMAIAARFGAWPYASVVLALGSAAMIVTGLHCVVYGFRSDVVGLPPIGGLSRRTSRAIYRLSIAGFHFLQPFARLYGRVRGAVSKPAWGRRRPSVPLRPRTPFARGARLLLGREAEKSFWSESWIDVRALLTIVANRLRRQRAFRSIELDSGWWEDRDLTIVSRFWFRVDIRALVEDHGGGRCLCRLRTRAHVTPAAIPLVLGMAAVPLFNAAGVISHPLAMSVVVGLVAGTIVLGEMLMTCNVISSAVDGLAADLRIFPMELNGVPDRSGSMSPESWRRARAGSTRVPPAQETYSPNSKDSRVPRALTEKV